MATQEIRVRIKKIESKWLPPSEYKIKTAQELNSDGDIDLFDSTDAKEIKFVIGPKLRNDGSNNPYYKFIDPPFCAYIKGVGAQNCNPGQMPTNSGWTYQYNPARDWIFTLNIPAAATPTTNEYVYKLFMNRTDSAGSKDIVIDPRIKDGGGYSFIEVNKFAGHEIWTLGLLTVFAFAAGGVLAWNLKK